jgi:hypothetical protein
MRRIAVGSLLVLLFAGCGPEASPFPTASVSGSISLDGTPLEAGSISLVPEGAGQARPTAADFKAGKYAIDDAPLGKVRVFITSTKPTGKMIPGSSEPVPEIVNIIPAAYQQGIVVDIAGDNHELNFALTGDGGPP